MARRAGKAATRRARQRSPRRPAIPQSPARTTPVSPDAEDRRTEPVETSRRAAPQFSPYAGSSLSERERADYHYVERDLRNIGILTALMAILLVVAWFAFRSLGIIS